MPAGKGGGQVDCTAHARGGFLEHKLTHTPLTALAGPPRPLQSARRGEEGGGAHNAWEMKWIAPNYGPVRRGEWDGPTGHDRGVWSIKASLIGLSSPGLRQD